MDAQFNGMGQRVRDLTELVDVFEAQEGEVQQIIGKTGNGKTYEGTRRALEYLLQGKVVYTSWQLILPERFDQRRSFEHILMNIIFNRKRFYAFDLQKNWHFVDIDRPDLVDFMANVTDAIFMLDEGQDVFDARGGMGKTARKTITRTRHLHKTLIIISQRAQAVDVTARANVTYFFKCEKTRAWFWPFKTFFKVYRTEEMDDQNYPIWEERLPDGRMWKAPVWHSHFASQRIYDAYNSWYLRAGIPKSQIVHFEAYDLTFDQKVSSLFSVLFRKKQVNKPQKEVSAHLLALSTPITEMHKIAVQYTDAKDARENKRIRKRIQPQALSARPKKKPRLSDKTFLTHVKTPPASHKKEARARAKTSTQKRKHPNTGNTVAAVLDYDVLHKNARPRQEKLEPKTAEAGPETTSAPIRLTAQSASGKKKRLRIVVLTAFFLALIFGGGGKAYACSNSANVELTSQNAFNISTSFDDIAQPFTPGCTGTISELLTAAKQNTGTQTQGFTVSIQADVSGEPSGISLATSSIAFPGASCSTHSMTFASPVSVTTGTQYWYRFHSVAGNDAGANYAICGSDPSDVAAYQRDTLTGWDNALTAGAYMVYDVTESGGGTGTSTASSTPYTGPTFDEWLFVNCVIIFFLSLIGWRFMLRLK